MAVPPEDEAEVLVEKLRAKKADDDEAAEKKGRKRKKPSKSKRDKEKKRKAVERGEDPAAEKGAGEADGKKKKRSSQEGGGHDKEMDFRAWVGGLPDDTDEQLVLEHFGACGAIRDVKLIRNSRLVFRGSCFISFKKDRSLQAALQLDGSKLNEQLISVKKAAAPVEALDLKVYVGGLPWKATEEVMRKDFEECGEIAKLHVLKDRETGKFRGAIFITYKTKAGVEAVMKYHGTDYGGKILAVRLASAKRPEDQEGPRAGSKAKRAVEPAAEGDEVAVEASEKASSKAEVVEKAPAKVKKVLKCSTPPEVVKKVPKAEKKEDTTPDSSLPFIEQRARARKREAKDTPDSSVPFIEQRARKREVKDTPASSVPFIEQRARQREVKETPASTVPFIEQRARKRARGN